ncbi:hypothetical protein, partial [Enterobacter hormaechei]|uniref:hypothetical protein n=1 Tax=Enterobacter hormaechei TaxID=158836 RepID=UPI0022F01DC7
LNLAVWGFDPALAVVLRYLVGSELLSEANGKFTLQPEGHAFAKTIMADESLMRKVKRDLGVVGKGITEDMVSAVSKEWKAQ